MTEFTEDALHEMSTEVLTEGTFNAIEGQGFTVSGGRPCRARSRPCLARPVSRSGVHCAAMVPSFHPPTPPPRRRVLVVSIRSGRRRVPTVPQTSPARPRPPPTARTAREARKARESPAPGTEHGSCTPADPDVLTPTAPPPPSPIPPPAAPPPFTPTPLPAAPPPLTAVPAPGAGRGGSGRHVAAGGSESGRCGPRNSDAGQQHDQAVLSPAASWATAGTAQPSPGTGTPGTGTPGVLTPAAGRPREPVGDGWPELGQPSHSRTVHSADRGRPAPSLRPAASRGPAVFPASPRCSARSRPASLRRPHLSPRHTPPARLPQRSRRARSARAPPQPTPVSVRHPYPAPGEPLPRPHLSRQPAPVLVRRPPGRWCRRRRVTRVRLRVGSWRSRRSGGWVGWFRGWCWRRRCWRGRIRG